MTKCGENEHPRMAPGQEPYTCDELRQVNKLISDAADEDPGEEYEAYLIYEREQDERLRTTM